MTSPGVWSLMMVFGLWQPPHFWLVVFAHPDDYLNGKLPSMLNVFSRAQLSRILFIWTAMLGLSMLALPLAIGMTSPPLYALELVNAVALIWVFGRRLLKQPDDRTLFIVLNAAVLIGVGLVVLERLRWGV
jgi:protoheme IX farnesyltransferase